MPRFRYAQPETLDQAVELLAAHGREAVALSGGTDLLVGLRHGQIAPRLVVDLKRVVEVSKDISVTDESVTIGGGTVMSDIVDHPVVQRSFPALVEAAATVGSIQIRNRATLAGNICHASPAADTAPPLLVYRAVVGIVGADGARAVPIEDFFLGPGKTVLGGGELVVTIDLPMSANRVGSAFGRLTRRRGVDLATVSVACSVASSGVTRLGLGAVGPRPLLVGDESGVLADPTATAAAKDAVLRSALTAATPISDVRAGEDYRRAMLHVLAGRTLARAIDRLDEG